MGIIGTRVSHTTFGFAVEQSHLHPDNIVLHKFPILTLDRNADFGVTRSWIDFSGSLSGLNRLVGKQGCTRLHISSISVSQITQNPHHARILTEKPRLRLDHAILDAFTNFLPHVVIAYVLRVLGLIRVVALNVARSHFTLSSPMVSSSFAFMPFKASDQKLGRIILPPAIL